MQQNSGTPGNIRLVWDASIPGETAHTARLGLRVPRDSPAFDKLRVIPGGPEWLRDVFGELSHVDLGYRLPEDPSLPLPCLGLIGPTLVSGHLGRNGAQGLVLELTDINPASASNPLVDHFRLRLRYDAVELITRWNGWFYGFTSMLQRHEATSSPLVAAAARYVEFERQASRQLAERAIRDFELLASHVGCPTCQERSVAKVGLVRCPACGASLRDAPYVGAHLDVEGSLDDAVWQEADEVAVRSADSPERGGMTVERIGGGRLWLSFHSYEPLPAGGKVLPVPNLNLLDCQLDTIQQLQAGSPRTGLLAMLITDPASLGSPDGVGAPPATPGRELNLEQEAAVARVLSLRSGQLFAIQGPPGTGKTTSIVEAIRRILEVKPEARILFSSHSNDAVDAAQERLLRVEGVRQVRVARPGKVAPSVRSTLLQGDSLEPFNLVAGTVNRLALDGRLRDQTFDYLILDEANKVLVTEALSLIPLARRWVMIGDLRQLPPSVNDMAAGFQPTDEAERLVCKDSFYSWIWKRLPAGSTALLPRQYRMREPIGRLVSELFYEGRLLHESDHQPLGLAEPLDRELTWVDTGRQIEWRDDRRSLANEFEADICREIATTIREHASHARMAVITMYANQVRHLRRALSGIVATEDIESVDAFEGREADVVILSLVRSNDTASIGFLNDPQRVNVAISRAKSLLVVVGDASTVASAAPDLFGAIRERVNEVGRSIRPGELEGWVTEGKAS